MGTKAVNCLLKGFFCYKIFINQNGELFDEANKKVGNLIFISKK